MLYSEMPSAVEEVLKIKVKEWNEHSNSFTTTEKEIIPKLDRLIKEATIIRLLILKQEENGKTIKEIRNIRLLAS